jgi:copper chaperone CopZ
MASKTFQIPNISCGHCVMTIKNEVSEVTGVSKVDASKETRMVTVEWEAPATWEKIQALLVEINYPPAPEAN